MRMIRSRSVLFLVCLSSIALCSCSTMPSSERSDYRAGYAENSLPADYTSRVPQHIASQEKTVVVNPRVHTWAAYDNGELVKAGLATSGADWCPDLGRPCHTRSGNFRINSLGSEDCKSTKFPIPRGGAPMPYCMYFDNGRALHGVPEGEVAEANLSHGCVRLHVADAEWLRYDFVNVGTKVVIEPY
jgi:lipoprotein-anchoring transpeptidase ErfK/SrfK